MASMTHREIVKNRLLSNDPREWLINARLFKYSALKMIEAYEKLGPRKSPQGGTNFFDHIEHKHTYHTGVYLLAHATELLLKALLSAIQEKPEEHSHKVEGMFKTLIDAGMINEESGDAETLTLVSVYLAWFGRYYKPQPKAIETVIAQQYTEPNETGLVEFKHKSRYPETHQKILKFFESLDPLDVKTHQNMRMISWL